MKLNFKRYLTKPRIKVLVFFFCLVCWLLGHFFLFHKPKEGNSSDKEVLNIGVIDTSAPLSMSAIQKDDFSFLATNQQWITGADIILINKIAEQLKKTYL